MATGILRISFSLGDGARDQGERLRGGGSIAKAFADGEGGTVLLLEEQSLLQTNDKGYCLHAALRREEVLEAMDDSSL